MKQKLLIAILVVFIVCFLGKVVSAEGRNHKPVADVLMGPSGITWAPNVSYRSLVLTVARPDGSIFQKTFDSGSTPYIDLSNICGEKLNDGSYTFELRVIPENTKRVRQEVGAVMSAKGADLPHETLTQTGYFQVKDGMIVTPSSTSEDGLSRAMDIVHADDVIIDGSLCVGNDCYSGLDFGFDTIVLMENNLRIFFDDTSSIQNYPRNDWRIICNDSTDGGGNYFAIQDATDVSNVLVMEAGAPNNSLYVDSNGDVGINTSTPYYELHIVDGDSPCIRLDQDGSYGWTPQKWDLCGNESNFFIRDATHASKLPFRIEPEAPTDSIFIKSNGDIGLGTGSPGYALVLERTADNAEIVCSRTSGAMNFMNATGSYAIFGAINNYPVRLVTNNSWRMQLNTDNSLSMRSGATCNTSGEWLDASSREYKENISKLTADEAFDTLSGLDPVKFNYKADKTQQELGFIAEDVPELVATKSRKNLGSMDIVAVLTKVLQEQQKTLQEQQKTISQLKKEIAELKKK